MQSINILVGHVKREPTLRKTHRQISVCTLWLTEHRRMRRGPDLYENGTLEHRLTAWGMLAERLASEVRPGQTYAFHYQLDYRETVQLRDNGTQPLRYPELKLTAFYPIEPAEISALEEEDYAHA